MQSNGYDNVWVMQTYRAPIDQVHLQIDDVDTALYSYCSPNVPLSNIAVTKCNTELQCSYLISTQVSGKRPGRRVAPGEVENNGASLYGNAAPETGSETGTKHQGTW